MAALCASKMSLTYLRNTSPSAGNLYLAADMAPPSLLAGSFSSFLNGSVKPFPWLLCQVAVKFCG